MALGSRLWLVRHAQPLVAHGVCYGRTDLPACPADTARAASALAPHLPTAARWSVSGLARAQHLAQAVAELRTTHDAPHVDPRLNEMDFGCFEMTPWNSIDKTVFDAWEADFAAYRFGGGESVGDLLARVAEALRDTLASSAGEHVWFTHAGVIQCVQWLCQPQQPLTMDRWPRSTVAYGDWLCLNLDNAKLKAAAPRSF